MTNKLNEIFDAIEVPVAYISKENKYLAVNVGYSKILNRNRADIVGQRVEDILTPSMFATISPYLSKVQAGEYVEFEVNASPYSSVNNTVVQYSPISKGGFVATFSSERVVKRYLRTGMNATVATLNHHINNTLVILLAKLRRLENAESLNEVADEIISLQNSVRRISKILSNISNMEDVILDDYSGFSKMIQLKPEKE